MISALTPQPWHAEAIATERSARLVWAHLTEPEDARAGELMNRLGPGPALAQVIRSPSEYEAYVRRLALLDLPAEQASLHRLGVRVLMPGDDEWPQGVDDLPSPPHCLFVRGAGHLAHLTNAAVALVGARAATNYGLRIAAELALGVGNHGLNVVSGGAFGIDAAAHRGALHGAASTVCVVAGGVDRAYPSAHSALFDAIAREGAIVSEAPLGAAPMRHRFLHRNRLIAALAPGTIVVEAGLRSGSLSTARRAEALSRTVGAVPGPVTSAASAGCHELIRDGAATLVTTADDVRELVGSYDAAAGQSGGSGVLFDRPEDRLGAVAKVVWDALPVSVPAPLEDVARDAAYSARETLTALGELSVAGMARKVDGGWCKATSSR